jgi:putative hydrolase of the HAD superfamily
VLTPGIIFDLDDTIVQFDAVAEPAWQDVCQLHSANGALFDPVALYAAIAETRKWYWSDKARHKIGRSGLSKARRVIVAAAFDKLGLQNPELAGKIADSYSVEREKRIHFFPGAEETLSSLSQQGVAMALITNGEAKGQRAKVVRFGLEKYFKAILIEGETGLGKPEEAVYWMALKALGLQPTDVWSIGDNLEWDVAAPQKLGIKGIWNDYLSKGLPASSDVRPDRVVHSIAELLERT